MTSELLEKPVIVSAANVAAYFEKHAVEMGWNDLRTFVNSAPAFQRIRFVNLAMHHREFDVEMQVYKYAELPDSLRRNLLQSKVMEVKANPNYVSPNEHQLDEEFRRFLSEGTEWVLHFQVHVRLIDNRGGLWTDLPTRLIIVLDNMGAVRVLDDKVEGLPSCRSLGYVLLHDQRAKQFTNEELGAIGHWVVTAGSVCLATMNFMNCRNVELVDHPPSRQQRRHSERTGEALPQSYKTLVIRPFERRNLQQGELRYGAHAVHIVRGHFKDFRQGPGLGRAHVHGIWWWASQVRGDQQQGTVEKEYEVRTA